MYKLLILAFLFHIGHSQLISPCPNLFNYEPAISGQVEPNRWYGVITLLSDTESSGVWLRIILDKQSMQLGNWFGEVTTTDNREYLIKNPRYKLQANVPLTIRFYVKYNPREAPPQLTMFGFNAKTVCPTETPSNMTTETPMSMTTMGRIISSEYTSINMTTEIPMNMTISSEYFTTSTPLPTTDAASSTTYMKAFNQKTPPPPGLDNFFHADVSLLNKSEPIQDLQGETCGTIVPLPRPLISYGQLPIENEFPWHAALYRTKGINIIYICGASLISNNHLITAAHCATKTRTQRPLEPDTLIAYLGKYYIRHFSDVGIQEKLIVKITVHPEYNPQTYRHNIAILKTLSPVKITNYVRPICLWSEDVDLKTVIDKIGTVVGWGLDETGRVTEQLTKAQMPVVTQETCIYSFPDFYARYTSSETYCAGFKNGTSVCNGDSGGGMVFPKTSSNPNNPTWQLRGLFSNSAVLQHRTDCNSSHYAIFTDVAKYLAWIHASMD